MQTKQKRKVVTCYHNKVTGNVLYKYGGKYYPYPDATPCYVSAKNIANHNTFSPYPEILVKRAKGSYLGIRFHF